MRVHALKPEVVAAILGGERADEPIRHEDALCGGSVDGDRFSAPPGARVVGGPDEPLPVTCEACLGVTKGAEGSAELPTETDAPSGSNGKGHTEEPQPKLIQPLIVPTLNAALVQPCMDCGGVFYIKHESITPVVVADGKGNERQCYICKYCVAFRPEIQRQRRPLIYPPGVIPMQRRRR